MNGLIDAIEGIQEVLAICPCCGELFRLAEARFVFPQRNPKSSEYTQLLATERSLGVAEDRLVHAEDRFAERVERQRQGWIARGRRRAKRKLRKIDRTFTAKGVDPQDVKAVFDPIEYVVFHGLGSSHIKLVELLSRIPGSRRQESVTESISAAVRRGDVEFEVLRMKDDGSFDIEAA